MIKELMKSLERISPVTDGRDKMEMSDVYNVRVTIDDLDIITPGKGDPYVVLHLKEYPDKFVFGGSVVTQRFLDAAEQLGTFEMVVDAIRAEPLAVKFTRQTSKKKGENGLYNSYTAMTVED